MHAPARSLSLEQSGLLTFVGAGDSEFLTWAEETRGAGSINPLASAETTLQFARFYQNQVLPRCSPSVDTWAITGGIEHARSGARPLQLGCGSLVAQGWPLTVKQLAPTDSVTVGPLSFDGEPAGRVAYSVLRRLYPQFGLDESCVPYSSDGEVQETEIRRGW